MVSKALAGVVAQIVVAAMIVLGTGCAMRVTGVVRDGATGDPMGGAVLTADDGRNRLTTTDPLGRFTIKTDWKPTTLTVSAPGFQTTTVALSGNERFPPTLTVDLQPVSHATTRGPLAKPLEQGPGTVGTYEHVEDGAAGKLRQLQELHDRGLISDEEYRRTRSRIVEGL